MSLDYNQRAFFELLSVGLWGKGNPDIRIDGTTDWNYIHQLALEQAVQGLVLQGLEWFIEQGVISKDDIPQELLLQWIGQVQMIEQQNLAMNEFVARLIELLRKDNIYALLVKGQGVAQCYERPLWRACGDIDIFLSDDNYEKAKSFLTQIASFVETENKYKKHLGLTVEFWEVELHGTLYSRLSGRVDRELDDIKNVVFYDGKVRSWMNNQTPVFLPAADEDVVYVFSHILQHFFFDGLGFRQICDWCRLLWTYRDSLNHRLLESRIRKMGLMSEWKAFAALAVECLGMPSEAMPLLDSSNVQEFKTFKKKAERICEFILEVGNFSHNIDRSYFVKYPFIMRKTISMFRRIGVMFHHANIFPVNSMKFLPYVLFTGLKSAARGE